MTGKITSAIFPVAGRGTRMAPVTKVVAKDLLPVFDRPALAHVVEEARQAGIERFIFVTREQKTAISTYFCPSEQLEQELQARGDDHLLELCRRDVLPPESMHFVQQDEPKGLGHAIACAREVAQSGPIAVLLPDVLIQGQCMTQMVNAWKTHGGNIVAVDRVPAEQTTRYGIVGPAPDADTQHRVFAIDRMVEKPKTSPPSEFRLTGRYILCEQIFDELANATPGSGGEIQLTDAMARLIQHQKFHAVRYSGTSHDCGNRHGYIVAQTAYALADPDFPKEARSQIARLLQDQNNCQ